MSTEIKTQVVVLGAGPAGYSAAFRCADLGLETVIVERYNTLGGVCLNVGCIPSKALLHVAKVIEEAKALAEHGIVFGEPKTDIDKIRTWKEKVINQLTGGLAGMAKGRKVKVVNGLGKFTGANTLEVEGENGKTVINFDNAIIAAGSRPIQLPFIPHEDPRIWDSTDALELKEVPERLLVMGGGIIGLEMGTVYHALGSQIDVVEMFDQVIPAADKDIVKVFTKRISKKFNLMLETKVTAVEAKEDGIYVTMEGKKAPAEPQRYDAVLEVFDQQKDSPSNDTVWAALKAASQEPNPESITSNTQWSIAYNNTDLTAEIIIRRHWEDMTRYSLTAGAAK